MPTPHHADPREADPREIVRIELARFSRRAESAIRATGITPEIFFALLLLEVTRRELQLADEIDRFRSCSYPNWQWMIGELVDLGLVQPINGNGRQSEEKVALTAWGRAVLESSLSQHLQELSELDRSISLEFADRSRGNPLDVELALRFIESGEEALEYILSHGSGSPIPSSALWLGALAWLERTIH